MTVSHGCLRLLGAFAFFTLTLGFAAQANASEDEKKLGRELFTERASPPCAICHTLADAQSDGTIGPDLDQLKPDHTRVMAVIRSGMGAMPAYEALSGDEVDALATYVSTATSN